MTTNLSHFYISVPFLIVQYIGWVDEYTIQSSIQFLSWKPKEAPLMQGIVLLHQNCCSVEALAIRASISQQANLN